MALTAAQQSKAWRQLIDDFVLASGPAHFTKADIIAAAVALDTALSSNAAAINNTLPEPFKTVATATEKLALLACVALRRAGA